MTTISEHIDYLTDTPADKACALALADRLQEAEGYTRFVALRQVARIRRTKWDAEQLAHASALLRPESMWSQWLMEVLGASVGVASVLTLGVILRPGRYWPKLMTPPPLGRRRGWPRHTVWVGAAWIINIVAAQFVEPTQPAGWNAALAQS